MKYIVIVLTALAAGFVAGMLVQRSIESEEPVLSVSGSPKASQAENTQANAEQEKIRLRYENEISRLEDEISNLEIKIAELKGRDDDITHKAVPEASPETPVAAAGHEERNATSGIDMRKYAKAIAKISRLRKEGKEPELDAETRTTMMEFIGDFLKLSAKYNIDPTSPMGFYSAPEVRDLINGLTEAFFDEMAMPLSGFQKVKLRDIMDKTGLQAEKMKDDSISEVQKQITMNGFYLEKDAELKNILNAEQYNMLSDGEVMPVFSAFSDFTRSAWDKAEDTQSAQNAVLSRWAEEMELDDTEKQNLSAPAEHFVQDYASLKTGLESKYGREFMDLYLAEPEGKDKKEIEAYIAKKKEYEEKDPDYETKTMQVETAFLELQLKYQKETAAYLPKEKEEAVKKQAPVVFKFPYLK